MKAAELCAGYGGLLMAARLAGWPVNLAWLSEVDADASKVLAHHHPGVPNLDDMTAVDWDRVEEVDFLADGIPCQGWSLAGKRNGSDDERDLWPVRKLDDDGNPRRGALDAIRVLRPRVFLLENVASLVSAEQGKPFATILTDLHELGYSAGWVTVGACRVGACHHRHRVFLIATLGEVLPPEGLLFGVPLSAAAKWPTSGLMVGGQVWPLDVEVCGAPPSASASAAMPPTPTAKAAEDSQTHRSGSRSQELLLTGFAMAYAAGTLPPAVTDEQGPVKMLSTPTATPYGNNQSPSEGAAVRPSLEGVVQLLPTPTAHLEPNRRGMPNPDTARQRMESGRRNLEDAIALLPTPRASDAAKGGPNQRGSAGDVMLPAAVQPGRFGAYESAVRRHEQALGVPAPEPTEPGRLGKPRLSPAFPEFMQCLPAGWLTDLIGDKHDPRPNRITRNAAIKLAGNGVNPLQGALAIGLLAPYMPYLMPSRLGVAA